jgi:hypothetical protein
MNAAEEASLQSDERTSLQQLRDILFGARARDFERKLSRLEARLSNEVEAIRDEVRRRFDEIESHVRDEIEALSSRIDAESTARVDGTAQLSKEAREADSAMEQRVHRVDESSARGQRELRRQLLDMTRELSAQVGRARQDLLALIDGEHAEEVEATSSPRVSEPASEERTSLH